MVFARNVSVTIGAQPILSGVSFEAAAGTLVGLLGPNGSGKTTLLRCLGGVQPYEGQILLGDQEVRRYGARELARHLAYVRQNPATAFDYTVGELVQLGRSAYKSWLGGYDAGDDRIVADVLREVELDGFEDRSVLSLSGGELQRAYLAQALAQETPLLLLDEPTSHLDVYYQFDLLHRLRSLVDAGRTVIAVLHDLEMAARFADQVVVLREGRVSADGAPAEVLTGALIAEVFRVHAQVETAKGRVERVRFLDPVRQAVTA